MDLKKEILRDLELLSVEKHKTETKSIYNPKHDPSFYSNLFWNSSSYDDVEQMQLELIPVVNDDQRDLFDFIRHNISSMPQCETPGRVLSVLVHDKTSKRYLGIIQLTTDLLKSEFKDTFIGLDEKKRGQLKKHIRDHSANLSICVPVQPFGFDFCGGKLLAMLAFSLELHQMYQTRYSYPLALITTTSIHGKSIQYDRLKQLKFIGYTKGYGTTHIPESFMDKVYQFLEDSYPKFNAKKQSKWQSLRFLTQQLHIDSHKLFYHGDQRGIYCGWTGDNGKDFLLKRTSCCNRDKIQSVETITEFWKERWAKQRSAHLKTKNA